jgi:hypothetical protein
MKSFVLYLCLLLVLASCSEVLVEKPKSIAVETFYNTQGEVEGAVAAIYSPVRSVYGSEYLPLLESSTDYHKGGGSYAPNSEFQGLNGTNITRASTKWDAFYLGIRNANLVIANVPRGKILSEEVKSAFIAEARYMRAFIYFELVRCWGGVILRTEANMDESSVPRSSPEEVYKLITEDLLFAETRLPDNASVPGRATKWAAKTLLADAYFYTGKYAEASGKAKEVMQSGKYALVEVSVADDFNKLFGPEVVSSSEEIFSLKYSKEQQWGYLFFTHAISSPYLVAAGYGGALYSEEQTTVYSNWDAKDLRKSFGWYKSVLAFGTNTILNKKFSDPGSLQPRNDYPKYRYADLLMLYAEAACEATGNPDAASMEALNMVHRRAYGYNSSQPSPFDFKLADYNKASFIELVRKERGYETQSEGKRWFDLKRTGKAKEYIKAATGKDVAEKHYLWPIPVSEMNYNEALDPIKDQNPGY